MAVHSPLEKLCRYESLTNMFFISNIHYLLLGHDLIISACFLPPLRCASSCPARGMGLPGRQKQKKQASTTCADFSLARRTEPNTAASLSSNRIDRIAQSSCISTCLEPFRLLSFSISATNETTGPVRLVPKSGGPEITQQSTVETRP